LRGDVRLFDDRVDAGRQLAECLKSLRGQDIVVLGLPRGGVPVAFEVAKALYAPLDVLVVRKLGVPFQPELAFGAIGEGGLRVINESVVQQADLSEEDMAVVEAEQRAELARRSERFRGGHDRISLAGRIALIVDDGVATGATAKAACEVARAQGVVVSRGGRPDLAGGALAKVLAPTLLIVGGRDEVLLELNRRAQAAIPGECELTVVPGATHLFEEPGTLEQVAVLARDWFIEHLSPPASNT